MQILDNLIIVAIHVLCFWAGMHISDKYHREQEAKVDYEVRLAQARIQANDYSVYVPRKRMPIGQPFLDRLKTNGHATQHISPEKTIA